MTPAMTPATTWPRTVAAVGIIVTLVLQLADTIGVAQDAGLDGTAVTTAVINWFSFFTTLSAVMAVIALLVRSGTIRISAAAYTLVAAVGYFTLLGGLTDPVGSVAWWTNLVLHAVVPLVMLVDLWVSRHGAHIASRGRIVGSALVLPAVWAVYTQVRGPLVDAPFSDEPWWFPYGVIDPHRVAEGYVGVIGMYLIVGCALVILVVLLRSVVVYRSRGAAKAG